MTDNNHFDVIIIGGSYAGLSAAMSLGRSLKKTLVLDSGKPCNMQAPYSHNLITQDGNTPAGIAISAREQVAKYDTVTFYNGRAVSGRKTTEGFALETADGKNFHAKKLVFATGLTDIMPGIEGYSDCWGISILHCPYCHGYEVRQERTAILSNGDTAFEMVRLISNWTKDLVLLTNGISVLTADQKNKMRKHNIKVIETPITRVAHQMGQITYVVLQDGSKIAVKAIYARPVFVQHCAIPEALGCTLTEQGLIRVNSFQQTSVSGVYACGDNTTPGRAVSVAIASGTMTGAFLNKEMIGATFQEGM